MDLNTGEQGWMAPRDGPRYHPALRDLDLPPLGGGGGIRSGPLVTPTLPIMNHGAAASSRQRRTRSSRRAETRPPMRPC